MKFIPLLILILLFSNLSAQLIDKEDESRLYAESKQVNQFFRRFNGEEDEKGNRYYLRDKQFRNPKLRKKYLSILFDESNTGISSQLKADFAKHILDNSATAILDFHGPNWFSEVHATFTFNGVERPVVLFMKLEKAQLGTKWVIQRVHAPMLDPSFVRDTTKVGRFLHPMSHELDFMNLRKAFANSDSISQFTVKKFEPDHLSVLLYEMKKGNVRYKTVEEVKFHFFQIDGWYFEISEFNRPGYNTGWLISNLVRVNNAAEKELLQNFIYK